MLERSQKKIIVLAIVVILLCSTAVLAQKKEIEKITKFIKKKRINAAYFMFGLNMLNLNNLNNHLTQKEFPTVAESYYIFGLGGHIIHNKFVVGIELQRFFKKEQISSKEFNTSVMAKYSLLNLGYLFYSKKGLMMYPLFGMGLGELKLRVIENNIHSFGDIDSYQRGSQSNTQSLLLNLGFGLDYFFKFDEKKKGQNNLMMGVRIGYNISAIKSDWSVNHVHVGDGPPSGLTCFYFRVVIGLGGWVEKLIKKAI